MKAGRRLVPYLLLGLLTLGSGLGIGLGLSVGSPTADGTVGSANAVQGATFASAVRRTIGASSFTMRLPVAVYTYRAPNQISVRSLNPDYATAGTFGHRRADAMAYLDLASHLTVEGVHGGVYDVRGMVTGPSLSVQELLVPPYPPKGNGSCRSSTTTACAFFTQTWVITNQRFVITGEVRIRAGFVASETFKVHGDWGFMTPAVARKSGTVTYAGINAAA
jgi:hypothetical protein